MTKKDFIEKLIEVEQDVRLLSLVLNVPSDSALYGFLHSAEVCLLNAKSHLFEFVPE